MEVLFTLITDKKLSNRGFLIGPYLPIYGIGCCLLILLLKDSNKDIISLFLKSIIICSVLEYFTSYIMEKLFKTRWWDYSDRAFNIKGRVCLENLIAFGVMGLAVIYFINPNVEIWIKYYINNKQIIMISLLLWTLFIMDFVISTIVVYGFRKTTEEVNREAYEDNTEQITNMVRKMLSERSFFHRRFINAYPKLEAIKTKMKEIKIKLEDATNDAKDAVLEKVNDAKDIVLEKTETIRNTIEENTKRAKIKISLGKEHLKESFKRKVRKERE